MLPAGNMRSFRLRRSAHGLIGIDESNHFAMENVFSVSRRPSPCRFAPVLEKGNSFAVEIPLNLNPRQSRWAAASQGQTAISGQSRRNRLMRLPISHGRFFALRRYSADTTSVVPVEPKRADQIFPTLSNFDQTLRALQP